MPVWDGEAVHVHEQGLLAGRDAQLPQDVARKQRNASQEGCLQGIAYMLLSQAGIGQ